MSILVSLFGGMIKDYYPRVLKSKGKKYFFKKLVYGQNITRTVKSKTEGNIKKI